MNLELTSKSLIQIKTANLSHDVIDGEVVIINLLSGSYYSIDAVGAEIWTLISKGASAEQISAALSVRYADPAREITQAVTEFIASLAEEDLVSITQQEASTDRAGLEEEAFDAGSGRKSFEAPKLHVYTDMQALLLLDPIHEVDDSGWPRPLPDTAVPEN